MFVKQCNYTGAHAPHKHTVRWTKDALKFMRNPESYPPSWYATYKCPGVKTFMDDIDWYRVRSDTRGEN